MDASFFDGLRAFLPKRVSLLPSLKMGVGVFSFICIIGLIYYRRIASKSVVFTSEEDNEIEEAKAFLTSSMFTILVIGVALAVARFAYNTRFYLDSKKINGDWSVYQRYFPWLFR
jgi:hypothetical protein